MKLRFASKIVLAALIGFTFSAISGQAQRMDNATPAGIHIGTVGSPHVVIDSTISPTDYITSVSAIIETDFDNNGFSGLGSRILPREFSGSVFTQSFAYAAVAITPDDLVFDEATEISEATLPITPMPVPEPSSFALGGVLALAAIVTLRRRRAAFISVVPPLAA